MARTISTTISTGVTLAPGDDPLTITPSGYVSGPDGIDGPSSQSWSITNQNTVLGTAKYGVSLAAGGTITNASGALISGPAGIFIDTPDLYNPVAASVSNAGTILATAGANLAIYLRTVGQVSNAATGKIEGGWGIKIAGPDATIDNQGLISATYTSSGGYGVYLRNGGTVFNGANGPSTATIQGLYGVKIDSQTGSHLGTVQNYGTILSTGYNAGVGLFQGGSLINGGSGATAALISGGRWGVVSGLTGTITNYATISSTGIYGGSGVYVGSDVAHVYNLGASALISGYVGMSVGFGTVTNAGTIASTVGATGTAVSFISFGQLVIDPSAVFVGTVASSAVNSNTIELRGSVAGTLNDFGVSFANFGTILVDAGASWTLAGPTSIKDKNATGDVTIGNGASLAITGALSSGDAFTLKGGALHIAGAVDAASSFDLSGTGTDNLQLDSVTGTTFDNAITGFGDHDTITFAGIGFAPGSSVISGGGTLSIPLQAGGTFTFSNFSTEGTPNFVVGANTLANVACFAAGTRIRTDRGEIAIETLRAGDIVVLADGRTAPVVWIGQREIECRRHRDPDAVWPVRVAAGALGPDVPMRDLMLSPDHALYLDGGLIPVRLLINGASIAQIAVDRINWYHVELSVHELLMAEGTPAESYLDTGNRAMFANGGPAMRLHPDFAGGQRAREEGSCAPFVEPARVAAVWRALAARAEAMGWTLPEPADLMDDPDLHVLVGARRINPMVGEANRYTFALPSGVEPVRLASRTARPGDIRRWVDDRRRLGVRVRRITFRNELAVTDMAIDDPALDRGWWAVEWDEHGPCRWTHDVAILPPLGAGMLVVELAGTMRYPRPAEIPFSAMRGTA